MMIAASTQAAAEYAALVGRMATGSVRNLAQSTRLFVEQNPLIVAGGVFLVVFLVWFTRPRS